MNGCKVIGHLGAHGKGAVPAMRVPHDKLLVGINVREKRELTKQILHERIGVARVETVPCIVRCAQGHVKISAGLGVIAADAYGLEDNSWAVQGCAVSAAMIGASLLIWTEKHWPDVQEALIGVMFILAATGGILLLADNPHGGEQLRELLVGQILWVSFEQLIPIAVLSAVVLAL